MRLLSLYVTLLSHWSYLNDSDLNHKFDLYEMSHKKEARQILSEHPSKARGFLVQTATTNLDSEKSHQSQR